MLITVSVNFVYISRRVHLREQNIIYLYASVNLKPKSLMIRLIAHSRYYHTSSALLKLTVEANSLRLCFLLVAYASICGELSHVHWSGTHPPVIFALAIRDKLDCERRSLPGWLRGWAAVVDRSSQIIGAGHDGDVDQTSGKDEQTDGRKAWGRTRSTSRAVPGRTGPGRAESTAN